jgi:hypothetical protein
MDRQQPSQTHRATIFLHPGGDLSGPLELRLPPSVVKLLQTLDLLQRRQAGETVLPTADDAPALECIDRLSPGEVEASIAGGVGQVLACLLTRREEVMRLSAEEVWAVHRVRALVAADTEQRLPDARQQQVAAELESLIHRRHRGA